MTYKIKCPKCGFEYLITCDEKDFEEIKEKLLKCPCGVIAKVEVEK